MTNYYEILGVQQDADDAQLKKAYRGLSLKYHPDRNTDDGAKGKFQEINEAYEVLSDPNKRNDYDMQNSGGLRNGIPFSHMDEFHDIHNLFTNIFGMGGLHGFPGGPNIRVFHTTGGHGNFHTEFSTQFQQQPPPPIHKEIEITLEQCFHGCSLVMEIERWTIMNNLKVFETDNITVTIPAGMDEGDKLLIRDKGNKINENLKGDLEVTIKINNMTIFKRQGIDLILNKRITLKEALCGFVIEIPHLNGKLFSLNNNNNPTVITPNFTKIINGLGMTKDNIIGNLILQFEIVFPTELRQEQIEGLMSIL